MKWKNKAKRTATTTSAILLAIMLTACSDQGNNLPPTATNNVDGEQIEDQVTIPDQNLPDDTGVLDPGNASNDDGQENNSGNNNSSTNNGQTDDFVESNVISAKGTYVGAADSHSIEVELEDQTYLTLQVGEDLQYIIDEFPDDQPVSFEYVKKTSEELGIEQNWLTKIELIK